MTVSVDDFREAPRYLVTSVALITTTGPRGPNVMAAEWTFQVSYRPMRLIVLVHPRDATHENIMETREFGANFVSDDQGSLSSLAGAYTGREVSKLSSELFETYSARKIGAPMIVGCFLNAECRVVEVLETGDHTMFLADVLDVRFDSTKSPLLYTQRRYWHKGAPVEKQQLVYVTCTMGPHQTRVDGRLQGVDGQPKQVSVTVSPTTGETIFKETVVTDERGFFKLVRPMNGPPKGRYVAKAEWNGLSGTAQAAVS